MQYGCGCGWKPRSSLVFKVWRRVRVRKRGTSFRKTRAELGEVGLCDLIATTSREGAAHGEIYMSSSSVLRLAYAYRLARNTTRAWGYYDIIANIDLTAAHGDRHSPILLDTSSDATP